ncbi:MAG: YcxB family protein [Lachnospiraceae bacterium]|nr:YcxB family protein [Lachnospiraceae bacterium]
MTEAKSKSVTMNFSALYSYILNTNYRSVPGIMGLALSAGAIVLLIVGWDKLYIGRKIMIIIVALIFTVINPLMLALKTLQQLKLSPSYKKPLDYTFHNEGITISQGEISQSIEWSNIYRLMMTKKMLAIYTNRINAFVIPLSELGEDRGKIISSLVQFTVDYKPILSGNLKGYKSGKGI